jgi:multidrug efflux system outer membrane protein
MSLLILLQGCTSPLGEQSSGIVTPAEWKRLEGKPNAEGVYPPLLPDTQAQVEQRWWKSFNDPVLDKLIDRAIENNKDLLLAKARVDEARAGRTGAAAQLLPNIQATGNVNRGNQSQLFGSKAYNASELDFQASWELDLFGQSQYRLAAAREMLQYAEASRQAVMVSLLSEVARNYFDMRNDQEQIRIIEDNLHAQHHTMDLTKTLRKEEMATELDLQRAASQVSTTAAQLPNYKTDYDVARNHLNVLIGEPPGTIDAMLKKPLPMKPLRKKVLIAAPASVLANRPDVRAAERQFAASISSRNAAAADIFPKISLSALFGFGSTTFMSFTPWSIGANLAQPLIDFGRIRSEINTADAQQQEAFLNYQKTVLTALEDMENALTRYLNETERNKQLHDAVNENRLSVKYAREQFQSGYIDLLDVLVAERNMLQSEADMAASDANLRKDLVAIYAAAGGGWDIGPAHKQKQRKPA